MISLVAGTWHPARILKQIKIIKLIDIHGDICERFPSCEQLRKVGPRKLSNEMKFQQRERVST
jgi:hypothetical protein